MANDDEDDRKSVFRQAADVITGRPSNRHSKSIKRQLSIAEQIAAINRKDELESQANES